MFERGVEKDDVNAVISGGETVADHPDDKPYPSQLLLGFVEGRPIHVVAAWDAGTETCIIVTAYEPQPEQWEAGFRKRRDE
ncbi:conserved hypothetical protein [Candidatus Sulfopaludibacter sp. SbA4]|nr:conserved hypothetical protein [Candidatus Sulfopaludibacter sp. SbA4]